MEVDLKPVLTFPDGFPPALAGALIAEDGLLITGHRDGLIVRWNLEDSSYKILYDCSSPVHSVSLSSNKEIAVGCYSGFLFVFPLNAPENQNIIQQPINDVHSRVWRVIWVSPTRLFATSTYGVLNVITKDESNMWQMSQLQGHSHSIFGIDSLDSKFIATGDYDGRILIWKEKGSDYEVADRPLVTANIQNLTWQRGGGFAIVHASGRISFFEQDTNKEEWRLAVQTDTATGSGTSISATDDGKTIFAGTESEIIQFELDSQHIATIPLAGVRAIFPKVEKVFALTYRGLYEFTRTEISAPANLVKYRFVNVSILGHTGSGKSTLCSRIALGTFTDLHSTFGKRIWNWDVNSGASGKNRVILLDHGGQEAVLETFLPFLGGSDMVLVAFKQKEGTSFTKAVEVLKEIESRFGRRIKVFLVQTHIDDPMNVIDKNEIDKLKEDSRIIDCLPVSSADGRGIEELKERLLKEIAWEKSKTMIEAQDVSDLLKTITHLQESTDKVVDLQKVKETYEGIAKSRITKQHLRFLLSNLSRQGLIEYNSDILDSVIINDEKYNELQTVIPISAKQKGGIIRINDIEAAFSDRKEYVRILDDFYSSTGICIKNYEARIFPHLLRDGTIDIPPTFSSFLQETQLTKETFFPRQELNIARLIEALSELKLRCVNVLKHEGLFSWETNACVYYVIEEVGNAITGKFNKFTYYVGGTKEPITKRLFEEFSALIEKLYGPPVEDSERFKKKELDSFEYTVALSYASEQGGYVEEVAQILRQKGVKVFYDRFEEARLWGMDLVDRFQKVYSVGSRWCMMFISKDYVRKAWPLQERQFALDRQLSEHGNYILPIRFDDSEVPGLSTSIHYINANKKTPIRLVELFLEKSSL